MNRPELPTGENRGTQIYRWRVALGWSAAQVAILLGVTPRTINLWETHTQPMPDARWRLFVHEISRALNTNPQCVVIFAKDGATPIDVISEASYVDLAVSDDGETALIASYAIDRLTNRPTLHRQRFYVVANKHVVYATERWESARKATDEHCIVFEMQRWLTRQVLRRELSNPRLTVLKIAISDAKARLDNASDSPEHVRLELRTLLDRAVAALMKEIS